MLYLHEIFYLLVFFLRNVSKNIIWYVKINETSIYLTFLYQARLMCILLGTGLKFGFVGIER